MENVGFKGLIVTLYQRVIVSYKTTLLGIAIMAGGVLVENLTNSPNKVVATIGIVLGSVLMLIKEAKKDPAAQAEGSAGAPKS